MLFADLPDTLPLQKIVEYVFPAVLGGFATRAGSKLYSRGKLQLLNEHNEMLLTKTGKLSEELAYEEQRVLKLEADI